MCTTTIMSVAASKLELESPSVEKENPFEQSKILSANDLDSEHAALEKLTGVSPSISHPVIAIDLDDVLSQTNATVAKWHNDTFGTSMTLADFYYYYYWKNPMWGSVTETFDKVKQFYATDVIYQSDSVPGAYEGVQRLRDMGYKLIIVTARAEDHADESWKWVDRHFPGIFDSIICTGQFKDAHKTGHEVVTKLSKAQVCVDLGAILLIDDSAENALQVVTSSKPTPVLLFGNYQWNQRVCGSGDACEEMSFDRRLKACGGKEFWKEEMLVIPKGASLWRVKDWTSVVEWVEQARKEGRLV
ncbi:hypothetical protein BDQ17DRAFT_1341135 [Cyathus striatus]|nr:hypothetical protein BDQ17DRAFT_1341135 [Cyathus striatus]